MTPPLPLPDRRDYPNAAAYERALIEYHKARVPNPALVVGLQSYDVIHWSAAGKKRTAFKTYELAKQFRDGLAAS